MDEPKFTALIQIHGPSLKRLCRGYEADAQRREELEQDVLLSLFRALPRFRGEASVRTFLFRVAHNTAIRHVKREVSRPDPVDLQERDVAMPAALDAAVDAKSRRTRLYAAIRALPVVDRELVLLHLEGLSNPEVAEVTGLTATNVSTRLSRIRAHLTKRLNRGAAHG